MTDQELEDYIRAVYGEMEVPEKCPWCGGPLRVGMNNNDSEDYFEYSYCHLCKWEIRHSEGDPRVIQLLERYLEMSK